MKKIVVLFSGEGKNLHNIIDKLHKNVCEVSCAITNKADALGLKGLQIKSEILEHTKFSSREEYDHELVKLIKSYKPDLVVLAGFMRILTPVFTQNIRSINLHPSLLPKHKGANAIEESFYSSDKEAGVSVHWVSEELDGGEIISQSRFLKSEDETMESFKTKIKELEYELLPRTISEILYKI
ncbi:phosphoribosylglycinamide formyltransferase [Sulfurimonas sp. HSL-1716]|uniref:phosphoribosylglycinamide formyltransferase n=1 Tax=Hydrocurvibacter sulfurireducens TaxID=3131937 RepID=UPI0031F92245